MTFSQRYELAPKKAIQIGYMDESLRNRLYNTLNMYFPEMQRYLSEYDDLRKFVLNKLGYNLENANNKDFNSAFLNGEWYDPYDILEFVFEYIDECKKKTGQFSIDPPKFKEDIQTVLVEEKSGYRLIGDKFVPITNEMELEALSNGLKTPYRSVNTHIEKAIALYADRKKPDYANSIKESISAVESICCIITKSTGSQSTLSSAIIKLKENGVNIHSAMEQAFIKLYGYTSNAYGIRHGNIDFTNAPEEDAKYMLVSCSAFVNYLIEKYRQAGEKS